LIKNLIEGQIVFEFEKLKVWENCENCKKNQKMRKSQLSILWKMI